MKKIKLQLIFSSLILCLSVISIKAYASNEEEYVTISVDATDDNGNLKYALDTDDPAAFVDTNEFTIPAGTSHTIYVKDVAGNITSQTYTPTHLTGSALLPDKNEQKINIEMEIGQNQNNSEPDYSDYEYLTDDPVEPGTGTLAEKIRTDNTDSAEKIFYTFTTKEGEVLYLVIDQGQASDNVYLLDTVSASDLLVLADDNVSSKSVEKEEDNLLAALSKDSSDADEPEMNSNHSKSNSNSNLLIAIVVVAIGGGAYYYLKIYKNKKDESMDIIDAMDMEEFEPEEPEDEEVDFDFDATEQEQYLEALLDSEDEELYDVDPEEYATSHMDDDYDDGAEISDTDEDNEEDI